MTPARPSRNSTRAPIASNMTSEQARRNRRHAQERGELKTGLAANHDASAALAQFSARGDRVDHDSSDALRRFRRPARKAREEGRRSGRRFRRARRRRFRSCPRRPPRLPAALTKQPTALPPVAANVSKETTGSIAPQTPIRGWAVREVRGNVAIVEGPYGFRQIAPGDTLPGAGHVERIEKRAAGWTVVTDRGIIVQRLFRRLSRRRLSAPMAMAHMTADYGPAGGEF